MKAMFFVVATTLLTSFKTKEEETINGLWTGIYKSGDERKTVVVRFEAASLVELYNEVVDDEHRVTGSYTMAGDTSIVFSYKLPNGKLYTMKGKMNDRKTFVDGVWENCDKAKGSFYLKKEKIQEMFIAP